jgi:hypothetical protein
MSAAPAGGANASQAVIEDAPSSEKSITKDEQKNELGEDDEFEDFPTEGKIRQPFQLKR